MRILASSPSYSQCSVSSKKTMSELISTAPLYTRDRVHQTNIGNILCTGKGCIGCDRKFQTGDQDLSEILGEVDLVDFDKQEPRFLPTSSCARGFSHNYDKHNDGRHGNTALMRAKTKKGKLLSRSKLRVQERNITKDGVKVKERDFQPAKNKMSRPESLAVDHNTDTNRRCYGKTVKTSAQSNHKTIRNKTVSFSAPLVRQGTFTLEVSETGKSGTSQERRNNRKQSTAPLQTNGHHWRSRSHLSIAVEPDTNFLKVRQGASTLINGEKGISEKSQEHIKNRKQSTAPLQTSDHHLRSRSYPLMPAPKTNFLKMLHNSSVGIFDIKSMKSKKESKWVKKVLKSGVKEEEIFPQIEGRKTTRGGNRNFKTARNSQEESTSNLPQRSNEKYRSKEKDLKNISSKDKGFSASEDDCQSSVLVIEHSHDEMNTKDESLYKLGFTAQRSERKKNFPDVSILEIAESLEGFVQLGVIKLICQEHEGCWYIIVSSRIIRDFLVQNGVKMRGRNFQLIDCTKNSY